VKLRSRFRGTNYEVELTGGGREAWNPACAPLNDTERERYRAAWSKYKALRNLAIVLVGVCFLAAAPHVPWQPLAGILVRVDLALLGMVCVLLLRWVCPHCNKRFYGSVFRVFRKILYVLIRRIEFNQGCDWCETTKGEISAIARGACVDLN
jgi:hypothetical protein